MAQRYHGFLIFLHWLSAFLIVGLLFAGLFLLHDVPNSDPEKLFSLKMHMSMGIVLLVTTIIRLIVRWRTDKPLGEHYESKILNMGAKGAHYLLYALLLVALASGVGISLFAGLPEIVFGGNGVLPVNFDNVPPKQVHYFVTRALGVLIVLHVLAAFFHQYIRRDGLIGRMWTSRARYDD